VPLANATSVDDRGESGYLVVAHILIPRHDGLCLNNAHADYHGNKVFGSFENGGEKVDHGSGGIVPLRAA